MRLNVYTEELLGGRMVELVEATYDNPLTGGKTTNHGLRIYLKSHADLPYDYSRHDYNHPRRFDCRSAVTFWCGSKDAVIEFWIQVSRAFDGPKVV
jgi:hypothetical protein